MTILTSHTSCQRNQVKSTNHSKTHISVQKDKTKASSHNSQNKTKQRAKFRVILMHYYEIKTQPLQLVIEWSRNTVLLMSTQAAIKGTAQYSVEVHLPVALPQNRTH